MGAFVLGVLVGWLAEWLFFTFWLKESENNGADCSSLEAELESKNRQISSLQSQLGAQTETAGTTRKSAAKSTNKGSTVSKTKTNKAVKAKSQKKPSTTKKSTSSKSNNTRTGKDDFTKLSGIGPSMAARLNDLGIDSFKKLAATDDDILKNMLEASGARMNNNKEVMETWNEQATVAASGDFAALKKMQEAIKK